MSGAFLDGFIVSTFLVLMLFRTLLIAQLLGIQHQKRFLLMASMQGALISAISLIPILIVMVILLVILAPGMSKSATANLIDPFQPSSAVLYLAIIGITCVPGYFSEKTYLLGTGLDARSAVLIARGSGVCGVIFSISTIYSCMVVAMHFF